MPECEFMCRSSALADNLSCPRRGFIGQEADYTSLGVSDMRRPDKVQVAREVARAGKKDRHPPPAPALGI